MTTHEELIAAFGRMREIAQISAVSAASAISSVLGRDLHAHEPRVRAATVEEMGAGATGVIFEMEGAVQGLIALFLPPRGAESVIDMLCPGVDSNSVMAHSALRELGNIVASRAVSSVADHLGDRITISVPILVGKSVDDAFGSLLFERRKGIAGIASEIDLCEPAGARRALLVIAPDAI